MGATRSQADMAAIARAKLMGAGVKGTNGSASLQMICALEDPAFAIFKPHEGQGFVIVSRDDAFSPVLGYSTSNFDADKIPCCMKWWMQEMSASLTEQTTKHQIRQVNNFHPTPIEPMLVTKWSQNDPYNSQTPIDKSGAPSLTGCVATAMGQVMNHHHYPASAKFRGTYHLRGDANTYATDLNSQYSYPFLDAYGAYYPYYDINPGVGGFIDYDGTEALAIGALLRDCGYAVEMTYSSGGSYAALTNAVPAFTDFFNYPLESVKFRDRKYYTDEFWLNFIMSDLKHGCPVIYGGTDPSNNAGHAFILHGVDADGNFAVNWGWAGYCDGYFNIDHLSTAGIGSYTTTHQMITGIRPQAFPHEKTRSQWYFYDESNPNNQGSYSFTWDTRYAQPLMWNATNVLWNASPSYFKGTLYFVSEDLTDHTVRAVVWMKNLENIELPFNTSLGIKGATLQPIAVVASEFKRNHTYRIYLASQNQDEHKENYFSPFECAKGYIYYHLSMSNQGIATISGPEFIPTAIQEVKADVSPAWKNDMTRVFDAQGRLLYSAPTDQFRLNDVKGRGVLLIQQGNQTKKIIR